LSGTVGIRNYKHVTRWPLVYVFLFYEISTAKEAREYLQRLGRKSPRLFIDI